MYICIALGNNRKVVFGKQILKTGGHKSTTSCYDKTKTDSTSNGKVLTNVDDIA